jgi:hypothetical protein
MVSVGNRVACVVLYSGVVYAFQLSRAQIRSWERCDNRIVTRVECLFSAMHTHTNNCQEMSCDGVIIKEEHRPLCDTKFLNRPVSNALASKAINRLLA